LTIEYSPVRLAVEVGALLKPRGPTRRRIPARLLQAALTFRGRLRMLAASRKRTGISDKTFSISIASHHRSSLPLLPGSG
jgi:hypothetical protein